MCFSVSKPSVVSRWRWSVRAEDHVASMLPMIMLMTVSMMGVDDANP